MALGALPATAQRPRTHLRPAQPGLSWQYMHTRPPATPTPSADHASYEDVRLSLIWPAQFQIEPAGLVARRKQTTAITLPLVNLRTTLVVVLSQKGC